MTMDRHPGRSPAVGRRHMVATSHPLATLAARDVLLEGGNAVDAAVAAAAVLGIVEPQATGIGGDAFALLYRARDNKILGLNASGRSAQGATIDEVKRRGLQTMPPRGILAVTVPGAVDGWCELLEVAGTMHLARVLAPAIHIAREGWAVTPVVAREWAGALEIGLLTSPSAREAWAPAGRAPRAGERFSQPDLAGALQAIAEGGRDAFYEGPLGERIVAFSEAEGGWLTREDFSSHRSSWVVPIGVDYGGVRLLELPPNGQGIAALVALGILSRTARKDPRIGSADHLHPMIEAVKLAFADRDRYVADPERARLPVEELLSAEYLEERARLYDARRAMEAPEPGKPRASDTVILATADAEGNMVALINSLYFPFGAGLTVPGTGITLHNRGAAFTLDPDHPNRLEPGKRPFHTLVPAMLLRDGAPLAAFGVMGADIQAQAHVQVVSHLVDLGMDIQSAIDAPRFFYLGGTRVALEAPLHASAAKALSAMGHEVAGPDEVPFPLSFGAGQGVMHDPETGAWLGGSDSRKDGFALGE